MEKALTKYLRGNMLFVLIVLAIVVGLSLPTPIQAVNTIPTPTPTVQPYSPGDEILEMRSRTSKTHWLGGNRYSLDATIGSIHYQDEAGDWQTIDNSFIPAQLPWNWKMEKADYTVQVLEDFTAGQVISFETEGEYIRLQPMALEWSNDLDQIQPISMPQEVAPVLSNYPSSLLPDVYNQLGTITWYDGYGEGLDFQWQCSPSRLEKTLTVENLTSLPVPEQYITDGGNSVLKLSLIFDPSIGVDIYSDNILWNKKDKVTTFDYVEFRKDAEVLWGLAPLRYWDSSNTEEGEGQSITTLEKAGGKLWVSIRVPYSWLQTATFPIYIDTDVDDQVGASSDDAYEYEGSETNLTYNSVALTSATAWGGDRFTGVTIAAGATVSTAYLEVYVRDSPYDLFDGKYLYCEDGNNPGTFVAENDNINSRGRTTANISIGSGAKGLGWETLPEAKTLVQEVIDDNAGIGGALVFIFDSTTTDDLYMRSYDHDTSLAAKLHIEYTAGGVSAPTVVTNAAVSVEETTATLSGNITATGGENASARGFEWDTNSGDPYADNWTEAGSFGISNFTHGITGLTKGELYYYIATANNSGGWGDGAEVTFLTKPDEPNTLAVTDKGSTWISVSWLQGTGTDNTTVNYRTDVTPTDPDDGTASYNGTGTSANISGLSASQLYYIAAWSQCWEGALGQSSDVSDNLTETTLSGAGAPTVVTNAATSVEETTATLSGNITATGGENPDHRGFYWDTDNTSPPWSDDWTESGNFTVGNFTHGITGLTKGEWYQYIASANNSGGSGNGTVQYFLTKPDEPNTLAVTDQGSTWITISWLQGTGTDNTTVNYSTNQTPTNPTDGTVSYNGTGTTDNITGLSAGQIYYISAWSQCWEGGLSQSSDVSDNLTDYTLPGNPSGMVSGNVTAASIEMSWIQGTGGDYTMLRRKTGSYPTDETDGAESYNGTGVSDNDTGLDPGTTYFYGAFALDSDSGYFSAGSAQSSNTTSTTAPTVTNNGGATSITDTTARLRGEITDTGGDNPTTHIYWGLTDESDNAVAWDNDENLGAQSGSFYYDSENLTASTTYFYRSYATNEAGSDWANSTANFTTLSEGFDLGAPTSVTITDHGAITLEFNWTKGVDSTYTMIRAGRTEYPATTTDDELIYYGANTTCNMTGFSLLTTNYTFTFWGFHSDNSTYSSNVTTANIGGEDMESVADEIGALATALSGFDAFSSETVTQVFTLLLCVAITGLAFWRNNDFLYILATPVDLIYGLSFADRSTPGSDAWVGGVIVAIIGISCLFKVAANQFERRAKRRAKLDG